MKQFCSALAAAVFASGSASAQATFDISDTIAEIGLAATEANIVETGVQDPVSQFSLGSVRFLRAIEKTLQLCYRHNAVLDDLGIPVLRLPIPPNPNPEPFDPALITELFAGINADMDAAREALSKIPAGADMVLPVDLSKLWFDINENGRQERGEGLFGVIGDTLGRGTAPDEEPPALIVHFDSADAAWLRAYTHLLSGISNLVIAFDPTDVIAEVAQSSAEMQALRGDGITTRYSFLRGQEQYVDMFAMIYGAFNRVPEASRTQAARDHFLSVVDENRLFWQQVALETDNAHEWIPNKTQVSALGFELPPETGDQWLSVLGDAEAVLKGELLVGHWRVEPNAGVNVAKLLESPVAVDIVTWIQGNGLSDVMETGPLVSPENLRRFERMFAGDALLFMVWLN